MMLNKICKTIVKTTYIQNEKVNIDYVVEVTADREKAAEAACEKFKKRYKEHGVDLLEATAILTTGRNVLV